MKKVFFFLILLLPLPVFAIKILSITNATEAAKSDKATPGQVIKIQIDFEKDSAKTGPYHLVLDNHLLNTTAFDNDNQKGRIKILYFQLSALEIAEVIHSTEQNVSVKLDVADKTGNFTNVEKANFTLSFPGEDLLLKQPNWRLDNELGLMVENYQRLAQLPPKKEEVRLYVNGILLKKATCSGITLTPGGAELSFNVDETEIAQKFYNNESEEKVEIGIGSAEKNILVADQELTVVFMRSYSKSVFWLLFIIIGATIVALSAKTDIIKDKAVIGNRKTYSLARTQFAFWTFFILNALLYIFFTTKSLCELPSSAFILLGISASVTIASQLVEGKTLPATTLKQENSSSNWLKQFLLDLLSDGENVSIHRLQNLLFTLFLGGYFWWEVINHLSIPSFDNNLLVLMGVSGAAYTVLKGMAGEDSEKEAAAAEPKSLPAPM